MSAEDLQINQEPRLGLEATLSGLATVHPFTETEHGQKPILFKAILEAMIYDFMGEEYDSARLGEMLDGLDSARTTLERFQNDEEAKIAEVKRRSGLRPDEY